MEPTTLQICWWVMLLLRKDDDVMLMVIIILQPLEDDDGYGCVQRIKLTRSLAICFQLIQCYNIYNCINTFRIQFAWTWYLFYFFLLCSVKRISLLFGIFYQITQFSHFAITNAQLSLKFLFLFFREPLFTVEHLFVCFFLLKYFVTHYHTWIVQHSLTQTYIHTIYA